MEHKATKSSLTVFIYSLRSSPNVSKQNVKHTLHITDKWLLCIMLGIYLQVQHASNLRKTLVTQRTGFTNAYMNSA
jgi:hypothetical protein